MSGVLSLALKELLETALWVCLIFTVEWLTRDAAPAIRAACLSVFLAIGLWKIVAAFI